MVRLWLSAVALLFVLALPAAAEDVVHTKDGRAMKGTIVEENDDAVKLKMRFGTVTIERANIERIEKGAGGGKPAAGGTSGSSSSSGPSLGGAPETRRSAFLGYQITKPSKHWTFKTLPPAPLTDLMVYHDRFDAEVSVEVDDVPEGLTFDEAGLKAYAAAFGRGLNELHTGVQQLVAEMTEVGGQPAFHIRFEGVSRLSKRKMVYDEIKFVSQKRQWALEATAPHDTFEKAWEEIDGIRSSFAHVKVPAREGQRYRDFDQLYELTIPQQWALKPGEGQTTLAAPGGKTSLTILSKPRYDAPSSDDLGKEREAEVSGLAGFEKRLAITVNALGTIGAQVEYTTDDGHHRDLVVYINRKRYVLAQRWTDDAGKKVLDEVLDGFAFQPDLTSATSLEEGRKANKLALEGLRADLANKNRDAIALYDKALELFPRFAMVHNNLASCYFDEKDVNRGMHHATEAFKLYSENQLYRRNMAMAKGLKGWNLIQSNDLKEGVRELKAALRISQNDAQIKQWLAAAHNIYAIGKMRDRSWAGAITELRKAMKLDPKNQQYRDNLCACYCNQAVDYYNKKLYGKAMAPLNRALKVNPNYADAKRLKAQITELRKRR